jgi:hypothetical protein
MRKLLVFLLILINLFLLYVAYQLLSPLVTASNAALMIDTENTSSIVTLNGKTVGSTPYKSDRLRPGDYKIKLATDIEATSSAEASSASKPKVYKAVWETSVKLTAGTQTVINRTFGPHDIFSAGEVLTLEKGSGLAIVTNPEGASITIDGVDKGKSPLSLEEKDKKIVKINKDGYFGRELTINIPEGFRLTISVNLALNPLLPLSEKDRAGNIRLLDLSSSNSALLAKPEEWADGVLYYNAKLSSPSAKLDLVLDYKGATYSATPRGWDTKLKETKTGSIGYLGRLGEPLTEEAKKIFTSLITMLTGTAPIGSGAQVEILDTPTGFLRVRATPSTGASEITQVDPGEKFPLLEERAGWYKIKLTDGKEGWVSGQYAKKL